MQNKCKRHVHFLSAELECHDQRHRKHGHDLSCGTYTQAGALRSAEIEGAGNKKNKKS